MKKIVLFSALAVLMAGSAAAKNVTLSPKGGGKDDRGAIMKAVKSADTDTLFLAAGEFSLSEPVLVNTFTPERVVIVGAGRDKTILKGSSTGAFVVADAKPHHVTVKGLTISGASRNEAGGTDKGAGLFADCRGGSVLFEDVAVTGCTALGGGGAVCSAGTNVTLRNCLLEGNKVTSDNQYAGYGGAVYFYAANGAAEFTPEAVLKMEGCTVRGNSSTNSGGGVCIFGNSKFGQKMKVRLEMTECTVSGNTSARMAGGIYAASYAHESGAVNGNVSLRIDNSTITHNEAVRKNSVGLGFGATKFLPLLEMNGTTVTLNETSPQGAGVCDTDLSLAEIKGVFKGNRFGKAEGLGSQPGNEAGYFYAPAPVNPKPAAAAPTKGPAAQNNTPDVDSDVAGRASAYDYGGLLAQVLQSGMVVQQGKPFALWGNAPAGQTVTVKADWAPEKQAVADAHGVWKLSVDVPAAKKGDFTAHTLTVVSGGERETLRDLLFGEVWLLSGQSNMTMSMKPFKPWHNGVTNWETEIAAADYPAIRLYTNPKKSADEPNNISGGTWVAATPETVAGFSAVGYYFARKLHLETGYPVGVVLTALGAMSCETFTPAETLKGDPALKAVFWDPYQSGKVTGPVKRPSHLYNGLIHPFVNLSIRGFGWYQGESNAGHKDIYDRLCSAMVGAWRERFAQGELPFYLVMVVPYSWKGTNINKYDYAYFRETQQKIPAVCPRTDICTAMDCGEFDMVHPSAKKPVGERLAALALFHDYGKKGVYRGPLYTGMKVSGGTVTVEFDPTTIGSGLTTADGRPAANFYLAGADKVFYEAVAKIVGDKVELTAPEVAKPVAVRYAFLAYLVANFGNKEGFTAFPFRSDDWTDARYYVAQ